MLAHSFIRLDQDIRLRPLLLLLVGNGKALLGFGEALVDILDLLVIIEFHRCFLGPYRVPWAIFELIAWL